VPGLDDAELVGTRAGLRPGSPDDLPMIGPTGLPGLVMATGHHRNGILLTPVTAEAVAAAVVGEPMPDEVAACDPRRFARAGVTTCAAIQVRCACGSTATTAPFPRAPRWPTW